MDIWDHFKRNQLHERRRKIEQEIEAIFQQTKPFVTYDNNLGRESDEFSVWKKAKQEAIDKALSQLNLTLIKSKFTTF